MALQHYFEHDYEDDWDGDSGNYWNDKPLAPRASAFKAGQAVEIKDGLAKQHIIDDMEEYKPNAPIILQEIVEHNYQGFPIWKIGTYRGNLLDVSWRGTDFLISEEYFVPTSIEVILGAKDKKQQSTVIHPIWNQVNANLPPVTGRKFR